MKYLILSNGAPNLYKLFNRIADILIKNGHDVYFAVDCHFSADENGLRKYNCYIFSDFFKEANSDPSILRKYSKYNLNYGILSDFDRNEVYNINQVKKKDYYEKLKIAMLQFFDNIITENNIDFVLYENVSNAFAYYAWFVCKENCSTYIGITSSRLPGRYVITNDPLNEYTIYEELFKQISANRAYLNCSEREFCKKYLDEIDNIQPDYMKLNVLNNLSLRKRYLSKDKIKKIRLIVKYLFHSGTYSFQRGYPLSYSLQMIKRNIYRKLKAKLIGKLYTSEAVGKFLLYPLHFHPESSTSILSGTYLNEYEVIKNIAFNLPQGMRLYVKDHISAYGFPKLEFYRKLVFLPNVYLLGPEIDTKKLIRKSLAVATLTSTVGYEALLLNKKVLLFGTVFYQYHKNVIKITDPTKLFKILNSLEDDKNNDDLYDYNLRFVESYYSGSFSGVLSYNSKIANFQKLSEDIVKEIDRLSACRKFVSQYGEK